LASSHEAMGQPATTDSHRQNAQSEDEFGFSHHDIRSSR